MKLFCKKTQNFRALGALPPDPRASGGWGLCPQTPSILFVRNLTFEISLECLCFLIRSADICSRGKNFLASLQTSTWLFVFPKEPTRLTCQSPLTVILYDPRTASANRNSSNGSYVEQYFQRTSRGARKSWWNHQASKSLHLCEFPHQILFVETTSPRHTCIWHDWTYHTVAVYSHFIIDGFIPRVLPPICLHCINTAVAFLEIRVIWGFQVCLLSRVTPNSLASLESSSFEPFIYKEPKAGFRLWMNCTISVFLLLNCSPSSEAQWWAQRR